ncbi:hypothetical protein EYV94_05440 [Puteibacter caeruleilacunae]|nr:hypothetical protein EYV94_05440 [Puteibacter caeruleilacunae]
MKNFNIIRSILIVLVVCSAYMGNGQERRANIHDFNIESNDFMKFTWENPAMLYFYPDSAYSDVALQWNQSKANGLYLIEKGDQQQQVNFDAQSFVRKKNSVLKGRASYHKGQSKHVKWNTVSDYDLVAPYVIADIVGGTAHSEGYLFEGGYTFKKDKVIGGVDVTYRTADEYRKLDPRPKTNISDLHITVGGAYPINDQYYGGLHVTYNDYQQEYEVKVFQPTGGIKVYYLGGMGISDADLTSVVPSNDAPSNTYEQSAISIGGQLHPSTEEGLWGSLTYEQRSLKLKNSQLDLVRGLKSNNVTADLGWQGKKENGDWKLKLVGEYKNQSGTEYNYENRKLVTKQTKYNNDCWNGKLSWMNRYFKKSSMHFWQATVEIDHANAEYKAVQLSSQALQKYDNVGGSLSGGVNKQYPHGALNVKLKGGYRINLNKEIKLAADAASGANETLVKPNYEYLTSDRGEVSFNIRYDFDTGKEYNLYVKTMPSAIIYPGEKHTYGFQLAVGLTL